MTNVTITTAVAVSTAQKTSMEKALAAKLKDSQLNYQYMVDARIIGGLKITIGSRELDGSLKNKLAQVHQSLTEQL